MNTLIIAQLTIRETQRRRILWLTLLLALGFLVVFGLGFHYVYLDASKSFRDEAQRDLFVSVLMTAGLYAINFLIIVIAVLISVTAVSGEIDSHTIEAILTKPIRRWELIMGKWLGYAALLFVYTVLLTGGIMLYVYLRAGFTAQNLAAGMGLMVLQGWVILTLTIAGGTRLSTLANGVMAFMMYGIAFIGGWVEQIGALLRNETAVNIGIVTSLIMPGEILWKKALALFNPGLTGSPFNIGPFAIASQPSNLMLAYAVVYLLVLLALTLVSFSHRDL
ncbi:MAG: ABC transporter permease subunit [Ardenticatenaceae bacterium]|nr:ABC transporter permease subunit [Ardenticatenaceae bacterium]MCB9443818.1 ABC transporter permease subunit [Ardenticatenaceae bacterium]